MGELLTSSYPLKLKHWPDWSTGWNHHKFEPLSCLGTVLHSVPRQHITLQSSCYLSLVRAGFRHVEAPGHPSVVELWRSTLP